MAKSVPLNVTHMVTITTMILLTGLLSRLGDKGYIINVWHTHFWRCLTWISYHRFIHSRNCLFLFCEAHQSAHEVFVCLEMRPCFPIVTHPRRSLCSTGNQFENSPSSRNIHARMLSRSWSISETRFYGKPKRAGGQISQEEWSFDRVAHFAEIDKERIKRKSSLS